MKLTKKVFVIALLLLLGVGVKAQQKAMPENPKWEQTAFSDLEDGDVVIFATNTNVSMSSATSTDGKPKQIAITVKDGVITPASGGLTGIAWEIEEVTNGEETIGFTFYQYGSSTNRLCITATNSNTAAKVTSASGSSVYTTMCMGALEKNMQFYGVTRFLGCYTSGSDWRTYNTENAGNYGGTNTVFYVLKASSSYSITYNPGTDATGTPYTDTKTEDVDYTILDNTDSHLGFTCGDKFFIGWNTVADGSGTDYAAGVTYTTNADLTLYAQWSNAVKYSVTYDPNGGEGEMVDVLSPYDENATVTVLANEFTAPAHTYFTKWNTQNDGTGTDYNADDTFTISENTILYAQWEYFKNDITLVQPVNGTLAIDPASLTDVIEGTEVTITATPDLLYTLETLKVYKTGDESTTVDVVDNVFEMPNFDVTIEATFVFSPEGSITIERGSFPSEGTGYDDLTWTEPATTGETISGTGRINKGEKNCMQFNSKQNFMINNTTAIPGAITEIEMVCDHGSDINWTPYLSATSVLTSATGTALETKSVGGTATVTWEVDKSEDYRYFYLKDESGAAYIKSITITYKMSTDPLSAPENFAAVAGKGEVELSWDKVNTSIGYQIEYADNDAFVDSQLETIEDGETLSTTITDLTNEQTYYFRIKTLAPVAAMNSDWSDVVEATPSIIVKLDPPTIVLTGYEAAADTYYEKVTVSFESDEPDVVFYFTTNGSEPSTSSKPYAKPFDVTTSSTIKVLAHKDGLFIDSDVASKTFEIINPAEAEFVDGLYEQPFTTTLGDFKNVNVVGSTSWKISEGSAYINGYSDANDAETYFISPKLIAENGKIKINVDIKQRYNTTPLVAKYSTNYKGYGDPTEATWNDLDVSVILQQFVNNEYVISADACHFAFYYTSKNKSAGAYYLNNFEVRQYYNIAYDANGGEGTMVDENNPYALGDDVTIMNNTFDAPEGLAFKSWNTQADGEGTQYLEEETVTMPYNGLSLFAQWDVACVNAPIVDATEASDPEYVFVEEPSFSVNIISMAESECDIIEYGFVYSTTNTEPTTEDEVITLTDDFEGIFETTLENLTENTTYYVRAYASNNAGINYGEVNAIELGEYPRYNIIYYVNGYIDVTLEPKSVVQGLALGTLPTPSAGIPAGTTFTGWTDSDLAINKITPEFVPTAETTLYAILGEEGKVQLMSIVPTTPNIPTSYGNDQTVNLLGKDFLVTQMYKNGSKLQWKANQGLMYNIDDLGAIESITLVYNSSDSQKNFVVRAGDAANPTTAAEITPTTDGLKYTFNCGGKHYFHMKNGTNAGYLDEIIIKTADYIYYVEVADISGDEVVEDLDLSTRKYQIEDGATLTVTNNLINTDASHLVINDGGQLIFSSSDVQGTFKKNMSVHGSYGKGVPGWYFMSAPETDYPIASYVSAANGAGYDLYKWVGDNENGAKPWYNYKSHKDEFETNFITGRGYLSAFETTDYLESTGSLNCGEEFDFSSELNHSTDNVMMNYALLGNPFTRNLTWENDFMMEGVYNGYAKVDKETGLINYFITGDIKVGEGFMVVTTSDEPQLYYILGEKSRKDLNALNITVGNEVDGYDNTIVRFDNKNGGFKKIDNLSTASTVYTMKGSSRYGIQSFDENCEQINVYFKANRSQSYTLSVEEYTAYDYIHLYDRKLGVDVDMKLEDYVFDASSSDAVDRFILTAHRSTESIDEVTAENFVNIVNGEIIFNGTGNVQVFDALGRLVFINDVNDSMNISSDVIGEGVFIVRMVSEGRVDTQKIVVK